MQKTIVCWSMASTYRFWLSVLGRIVRPGEDRMSRVSTSGGRMPDVRRSMSRIRSTAPAVSSAPPASRAVSSSNRSATSAVSAGVPEIVISLPRTWMSASNEPSITRSSSSPDPSRATIECSSGMTTLTWVGSPASGLAGVPPRVRFRGSPDVSVNSLSPKGRRRVPALAWSSCYPRGSARWPAERPATKDVGVGVEHRLPGLRPGVEDHPVSGLAHPFVLGDLVRQGRHLVQQAIVGGGECCQITIVVLRYDKHMGGRLRVDVPEGKGAGRLGHALGRDIPRYDRAEKAIRHGAILACNPPNRPPTYMVAWLRILGARPHGAWTRQTGSSPRNGCVARIGILHRHPAWRRIRDNDKWCAYLRQWGGNRARSVRRHRVGGGRNAPKPAPDMPSAEQGALTLLERTAVVSALRSLPPRQREALVLRYYG